MILQPESQLEYFRRVIEPNPDLPAVDKQLLFELTVMIPQDHATGTSTHSGVRQGLDRSVRLGPIEHPAV